MTGQAALLAEAVQRILCAGFLFVGSAILGALLAVMVARTPLSYGNGIIGLHRRQRQDGDASAGAVWLANASVASTLRGQTGGKVSVALDAVDEADSYFSQYMPRMIEAAIIPVLILVIVLRSI